LDIRSYLATLVPMVLNNFRCILLGVSIVVFNIIIGHFFAPNGIMLTPFVILLIVWLLSNKSSYPPLVISVLSYILIALNDVGLKLYAGGKHDGEGGAWLVLMSAVGLVVAFFAIVGRIETQVTSQIRKQIVAVITFVALVYIHSHIFGNVGLGRYYWYSWNS
jgi:hypothetical protein